MSWRSSPPTVYECTTCKCLMHEPVKRVKVVGLGSKITYSYCGKCAPAYDKILTWTYGTEYYRMTRCNKDGTPWTASEEKPKTWADYGLNVK